MLKNLLTVFLLIVCYLIVLFSYKSLSKRWSKPYDVDDNSQEIIKEIKLNTSYPLISDMFDSLNQHLAGCGVKLHADLRGYLI